MNFLFTQNGNKIIDRHFIFKKNPVTITFCKMHILINFILILTKAQMLNMFRKFIIEILVPLYPQ